MRRRQVRTDSFPDCSSQVLGDPNPNNRNLSIMFFSAVREVISKIQKHKTLNLW